MSPLLQTNNILTIFSTRLLPMLTLFRLVGVYTCKFLIASMQFHNFFGSIMQQSLVFWTRLRRLLSRRRLLCRRLRQTAISYGLMTKLAPKLPPHIFVHTTLRKHIHTKDYIDKRLSKPKLSAAPGNSCTLYARYVGWRHYTALHMRGGGELRRRRRCLGAVVARRSDI